MTFEVDKRLYLTGDDRVVPDGDPDARWLYAVPGKRIPLEDAEKYGLVGGADEAPDAESPPDEEAEVSSPDEAPTEDNQDSSSSDEKVGRKGRRTKKGAGA